MINEIYNRTLNYLDNISKEERKEIGQFFTQPSIAIYMASLMTINKNSIRILDAGAGSGILTSALCQKCLENNNIENIEVVAYENNETVLPLLRESMELISTIMEENNKNFIYQIVSENFILYNENFWKGIEEKEDEELFDIVISNPPYKKIRKNDNEAIVMKDIVHGQPNIYFLFMAMSAKLLKDDGEMIFINPRSFTSGAYFKEFRKWFLDNVKITDIHLFNNRGNVFKSDKILQETLILKAKKTDKEIKAINITTSPDDSFNNITKLTVCKKILIDKATDDKYILIPTNQEELEVLNLFNSWNNNLESLGFKISTGKVVDFRATEFLTEKKNEYTVPLLWASNFNNNRITHPIKREKTPQYILLNEKSKSLLIENKDYILIKRFTSKEEAKRVQCALYFTKQFNYNYIGVENHLNYIYKVNGDFSKEELYGLFTVLNSSFVDKYYRILNGSTQVNAGEMNAVPLPSLEKIINIGQIALNQSNITVEFCDRIIEDFFINQNKYFKSVI